MAARIRPLFSFKGEAAARLRRRRSSPEGWVQVYLGLVARTFSTKHGRWLEAEHASHWAWPGYPAAAGRMQQHRQHGATTLILEVWAPVWSDPVRGIVEVGHSAHYESFVRSLCWVISAEVVPDTWARKPQGRATAVLEWRLAAGKEEARLPVPDHPEKRILQPQGRYSSGMERPRLPLLHAKEVLAAYYVEHGILPSVQRLAELLGVSSTSSAHYVVTRLRAEGYLGSTVHGKLTPGPLFLKAPGSPSIPVELLAVLPSGPDLRVGCVDESWTLASSIWEGDLLILAFAESPPTADALMLLRRGSAHVGERASVGLARGGVGGGSVPAARAA